LLATFSLSVLNCWAAKVLIFMDHLHARLSIRFLVCVPKLCGNNGAYTKKKRKAERNTNWRDSKAFAATSAQTHSNRTHSHIRVEKEQDAEAAFESCPVAVNINSR